MRDVKEILAEFKDIADNPRKQLDKYLAQGKKVVGVFPVYTPEELVHAAGMIPMGLWGGQITPTVAGKYNPIYTCSIMRSCLEYGMTGIYKGICCAVMPILCDTFRGMSSAWRVGVKDIPLAAFVPPQNRTDPDAGEFLVEEYKSLAAHIEKYTGASIKPENIEKSIAVYNEHTNMVREFLAVSVKHLDLVTPTLRHAVMKSSTFMEKGEHTALLRELVEALNAEPECEWQGKKVILSGITAEPDELLGILEENKIAVVGDDLAQESRQYRTLIPGGADPYAQLAQQWLERRGCSTVHEVRTSRGDILVAMAQEYKADGVLFCLMRFCDVEEYEYPFLSEYVENNAKIPSICIEIDQSTQNNEQSRTKLQSFAEMN